MEMDPVDHLEEHVSERSMAGRKLLDKFSAQWEQLHCLSETNIGKSSLAINKLNNLDRCFRKRLEAIQDLSLNYKSLFGLEVQINDISSDLNNLGNLFVAIETYLSKLSEKNEKARCDGFVRQCRGEYEAHAQMAKIETELARDHLMTEHLKRVQAFEKNQQQTLEERRKVLSKEFEAEKARYLSTKSDER